MVQALVLAQRARVQVGRRRRRRRRLRDRLWGEQGSDESAALDGGWWS
jgi:hypothetical protein